MARSRGGSGARNLKTRVKTARGRKLSSTRWLQRQLNDPYVQAAKRAGYRSRAAFKLQEIDDRHAFLKPGAVVLDLGCAPGGWCQIAAARVCAGDGRGRVIGIDLLDMAPLTNVEFLQLDFMSDDAEDRLRDLAGGLVDVVLTDMAPSAMGHKQTDHLRIVALCEAVHFFARTVLSPGGVFLAKVLRGGADNDLLTALKLDFGAVRHVKPAASRKDSSESYVLATGFRGNAATERPEQTIPKVP